MKKILIIVTLILVTLSLATVNKNENIYSDLTYTALGDSITYGKDGITGDVMQDPYVKIVGDTLGLKETHNLGVSWSTIAQLDTCTCHEEYNKGHFPMCKRVYRINIESDIISISGGVNDFGKNVPLGDIDSYDTSTFYGAYNTILRYINLNYPQAWVFLLTPTPTRNTMDLTKTNDIGLSRSDYYNAVIQLGKKWGIPVCELHDIEEIKTDVLQEASDGVHPSQECVRNVIAPTIVKFIKENYKS